MENKPDKISLQLKLIAIHLGASNTQHNERHKNFAKTVCETVMKESCSTMPIESSTNSHCLNALCRKAQNDRSTAQSSSSNTSIIRSADEAVVRAVELMENDRSLNCGLGSNLNLQGKVECDASLMSSKNEIWSGVGAVLGCENPIKLAKSLHDHITVSRPLGLVQPNFLVASGAKQWMREHCPDVMVPDCHLITAHSFSKYQDLKSKYDQACKTTPQTITSNCDIPPQPMDTVGAVAVDCNSNFACAISSGGIILKHRGRIGQAALAGAGCWAQDSMAITTTGVGEYLTTTLFAKKFHEKLMMIRLLHGLGHSFTKFESTQSPEQARLLLICDAMTQCFRDLLDSPALGHVPLSERLAGMLAVCSLETNPANHQDSAEHKRQLVGGDSNLYLSYGHNTKSLCVSYMLANAREAVSFVSSCSEKEKAENDTGSLPMAVTLRTIELNCD